MTRTRQVLVLRHCENEALGTLPAALAAEGLELRVIDCFAADWPRVERAGFDPRQQAGLVVMGGTMNADQVERFPFLASEVEWLARAVAARLPTLGICLGAQLLAKAAGGRVFANAVKEIGWHTIELLPAARDDRLMADASPRPTVFQWHGDTFELPEGGVPLARSPDCEQQAFRLGPNAYGVQFHPEMTLEMVLDWLGEPGMCAEAAALDYVDAAEIRRRAPQALADMAPFSRQLFGGFGQLCRGPADAR